jgi:hypothetical protein
MIAVTHAARAVALLVLGIALRDCVMLAASVLMYSEHLSQRLHACPDRAHAWPRCVLNGAALLGAGAVLAAHTAVTFFGWWPAAHPLGGLASAALLLVVALGGLHWRQLTIRHAAIVLGMVAAMWLPMAAVACAFAALVAAVALADGLRHLGPMSRALAAPHQDR